MTPAAVALLALVVQDHVSLRSAPHDAAPKPVTLWQGDLLEVRGERLGYLQVYDLRRERPGYVRPSQVRKFAVEPASAAELKAVALFLRDTPGSESLGIAYLAAFLKVAPAREVGTDAFDALGVLADRLGRRASAKGTLDAEALAGQLEVADSYGVKFRALENGDRTRLCYDGEAFRRVLALGGTPDERARAALALTGPECAAPEQGTEEVTAARWALGVLEQADPTAVAPSVGNKLRLRRAAVLASLAFEETRIGEAGAVHASQAVDALATVDKSQLADEDRTVYDEAVVRVGASRWAAEPQGSLEIGKATLSTHSGRSPGETCVALGTFEKCTFGEVWLSSARISRDGDGVAFSVQTMPAWSELWVLRKSGASWSADVLPPAAVDPDLGYAETAGWSPDGKRLLVVSAARGDGQVRTRFEVLDARTLAVQKSAGTVDAIGAFHRWAAAAWRAGSVALR